ncbi:PA14 domain-containing protein [Paenibacillus macerans]|uniref:PA14 domain-containing protein n=1 Tax=Paenibacillus macerans TaxID=44252 RepID=UPI003D312CFF
MKKRITLTSRLLAIVVLLTSLFSAGYIPVLPAKAESGDVNVFAGAGATATANGEISDEFAAAKAIDGNLGGSKWAYEGDSQPPGEPNPYWLKVDAGAEATVHRFVLAHAGAAGEPDSGNTRAFTIETSLDDVSWTPAVTVTDNTYGTSAHELDVPVTARFFKLNITDPGEANANGNYQANIYEFEAYGTLATPSDAEPETGPSTDPELVPVTGITLDKPSLELTIGETAQLKAEVAPANATDATYAWTSDDSGVATVSPDGLVTAVGAGTTGITATTTDGGYKASALVTVAGPAAAALADPSALIPRGSEWKYLDDGTDQGTAWRDNGFDVSGWKQAPASLGYASNGKPNPPATVISYGPDSGNKYITTYFRKTFEVADASAIRELAATLIRDDGAVVYLNGEEVFRTNMPSGTITYTTRASGNVADPREEYPFTIDPSLLVNGTNVLAVEVHQDSATSSDLYFDLDLKGDTAGPPVTGNDQGLLAQYYTGTGEFGFGELKATTVDSQINFTNLDPVLQSRTGSQDHANARWTGRIMAPETGDYTFYMIGDNGFRLWIDDQPVIDHWVNDWDKEQTSAPITLQGGQKYNFKVEYFEDKGGSNLYLRWSTPSLAKDIVPASAFYLPEDYSGPIAGSVAVNGLEVSLSMAAELDDLPAGLKDRLSVTSGGRTVAAQSAELGTDSSVLKLKLSEAVRSNEIVNVTYDGQGGLRYAADGRAVGSFAFSPENRAGNYAPIAIAMSFYKDPQTKRSFAWYTNYDKPENAPAGATDSIVDIVPAGQGFDSPGVMRFVGKPEDTRILNLKITNTTNGSFISHKVLAQGLLPGTAYQYRVGSDGNWSQTGTFTTEGAQEPNYEFLYLTDSQGANTHDYEVWADTLGQALDHYPKSKFMIMTGDQVDAGALESQWLDYFGKPQDMLMHLPIMAAVGNHEGPYNDNYYYHFYYPNDSIDDPLPPGSVYSFDYGDAHFMVLNTMDMGWDNRQREAFKQQIEWLKREVAQTDKKWKVVAFHKAIYSVGGHSADSEIFELRDMLYPVFDELGIDIVLQGHDHTYMRSYQMYDDTPIKNPELDDNGNPLNPDGTMYIVNNSAGTKYYDVNNNIDKYYAAVYEQRKTPIYSGIRMTKDSFTIESYRSGEQNPFDAYTIVRTDDKPDPVRNLSAGKTGNGKWALTWTKPENGSAEDGIRGYRIYEANGKLGMNWSVYVPAEEGKNMYQYIVDEADPSSVYEFAVTAVDKRDNSEAVTVKAEGNAAASPVGPVVDDGANTFGWTHAPGFDNPADYEYSVDGGATWQPVTANPQPIGTGEYPAGRISVRVKANAVPGIEAGVPLPSDQAFTNDLYSLSGKLTRDGKLKVDVTVKQLDVNGGEANVVFQLMNGNTPVLINAIPVKPDQLQVSQYFNVSGANYKVKVFVMDRFNSDPNVPVYLSRPLVLQ